MASFLKVAAVAAVVAVLAATAAAGSYISTPATADFLLSPVFLWIFANVIIVWLFLFSSSRGRNAADASAADTSSSSGNGGQVLDAVYDLYSLSEYEAFSDAGRGRRADSPAASRRQAREARGARRTDRPRVRKKPAREEEPSPRTVAADACGPDDKKRGEEAPVTAAAATDARPGADGGGNDDDNDVSLDSLWQSIVQRRAARPVAVRKSETWSNDELPRLQRVAETAVARREMRKSVSAVNKAVATPPPAPAAPSAVSQLGWRTRDVLVTIAPDELLRRAESFIRRQREHLRLQRQESEQRQALELRRLHAPALIRV